ncbi:MAG: complex I NDUFA9 subunit family protein [Sulfobacillus benefaciens]|uniref:Complex I NDUFA9 subunit family protein n=1 Tax=Sulfobacillus benefaciens TaxID=453960 RepID=A0A2T2XCE7_9FIRM|nr:MAG: complex I NDUFA9 subunit family protein [Sulfobacillus benefaciens]
MMQIVVLGGTGYVGRAVQEALLMQGHHVKVIARHGFRDPNIQFVSGDVRDMDLMSPFDGADAIINLIGIIEEHPAQKVTFELMHVEVVRRVISAMSAAHVYRLVHMSALGTRPGARSRYHKTKWIAEDLIRHTSGLHYTIIRPSLLFGGGAPFFKMLQSQAKWPITPIPGSGTTEFDPVFHTDVGQFVAMAAECDETIGETFEVGGPDRFTLNALYQKAAVSVGKHGITPWHISYRFMMNMARIGENLPGFPVSVDQLLMLGENNTTNDHRWTKWVKPTRLQPSLIP